jgi:hypothetical protein
MGADLPPVTFSPRPSRQFRLILRALQLITGLVLVVAPVPVPLKVLLLAGVTLQVVVSHRRLPGGSQCQLQQVRIDHEHRVRLVHADGRVVKTRLRADSVITPAGLLLRFAGAGRWPHTSLLLGPDSLSDDELRRLRLLLRFGGPAPEEPQ